MMRLKRTKKLIQINQNNASWIPCSLLFFFFGFIVILFIKSDWKWFYFWFTFKIVYELFKYFRNNSSYRIDSVRNSTLKRPHNWIELILIDSNQFIVDPFCFSLILLTMTSFPYSFRYQKIIWFINLFKWNAVKYIV